MFIKLTRPLGDTPSLWACRECGYREEKCSSSPHCPKCRYLSFQEEGEEEKRARLALPENSLWVNPRHITSVMRAPYGGTQHTCVCLVGEQGSLFVEESVGAVLKALGCQPY